MNANKRSDLAEKYFREGYNCPQTMLLAFQDKLTLPIDELLKLSSAFGGGMSRMREDCGAVTGAMMVIGLLYGFNEPEAKRKAELYEMGQEFMRTFEEKEGALLCRDLLGLKELHSSFTPTPRTPDFYEVRPCLRLLRDAAEILSELIE